MTRPLEGNLDDTTGRWESHLSKALKDAKNATVPETLGGKKCTQPATWQGTNPTARAREAAEASHCRDAILQPAHHSSQ